MSGGGHPRIAPRALALLSRLGERLTAREIGAAIGVRQDAVVRAMMRLELSGQVASAEVKLSRARVRTEYWVEPSRTNRPADPVKRRAKRFIPCLGTCGQSFWSEGPHNRLCARCGHQSWTSFTAPAQVTR